MKSKCCNADTSVDIQVSYDIRNVYPEKEVSIEYRCLKCSKPCEVLDNAPVEEFKGTYKGKDINTMTREELMEALIEMGELYTIAIQNK